MVQTKRKKTGSRSTKRPRIYGFYKSYRRGRYGNLLLGRGGKGSAIGPFRTPIQSYARVYGGGLLPTNLNTTFSYHATWADTTAGGFAQYAYRANSVYDPDLSGTGTKAIGVTAMANLYNRYRVYKSVMKFTVVNNDTDDPVHICIVPQKTSTALTLANKESVPSQPGCVYDIVTNQAGKGTVTCYTIPSLVAGINRDADTLSATLANNPATETYFIIYIFNESGNALNCQGDISISYHTILSDIDYANITGA